MKNINDITTYEVGDILVENCGERKVLAICGEAVLLSYLGVFDGTANWYTVREILGEGLKFKETPTKEEALETVLEFVERWNKGDEEQEVAEAAGILQEGLKK